MNNFTRAAVICPIEGHRSSIVLLIYGLSRPFMIRTSFSPKENAGSFRSFRSIR